MHPWILQYCSSMPLSGQFEPPYFGKGLLHSLVRLCFPPKHFLLQFDHWLQFDQFPFCGTVKRDK